MGKYDKLFLAGLAFFMASFYTQAQEPLSYQIPPSSIVDLVDAPVTPVVSFSRNGDFIILLERETRPGIEELAKPELRIGGIRIDPRSNGPSRESTYKGITVKNIRTQKRSPVTGLPPDPKLQNISLSKDEKYLAFTHRDTDGISLWLVNLDTLVARQLTGDIVNAAYGNSLVWTPDNKLLIKTINPNRGELPKSPQTPIGPNLQETAGNAAPSRTYQDLVSNPHDEALLEYYLNAQLMLVDLQGKQAPLADAGMIKSFSLSPDGRYLTVDFVRKPFSYLVPVSRFPYDVEIWDIKGNKIKTLAQIPLDEVRPTGFDATVKGPRDIRWRADKPATLYWVEAQDGGDPKVDMEEREIVFMLDAPFKEAPKNLASTGYRFDGIYWSDDHFALLREEWLATKQERISLINPSSPGEKASTIIERSSADIYNDPGNPVLTVNDLGRYVLLRDGDKVFMTSEGGSPEGSMPYLSTFNVKTKTENILWRSQAPYYERVAKVLNKNATAFVTIRESTDIPPNYWLVNTRKRIAPLQITDFPHPYPSLQNIHKELVKYKRKDGLDLSAVIYTPAGYDPSKDGKLPVLMWAYPREYKSAAVAAQVRGSKYAFTQISWGSPIYWVTRGYAIMDQTEMPIVGEGAEEPNDAFVEQLVANAEAAIDYIEARGIGDRSRIAVGGHSYGAFMAANLLSHSDLFAAGLARSGAYNRTLTPFGFQFEQRTYWEAPEVYHAMSPFMHAHKVKSPILLIHGEADNNAGTFPVQSERYYNALKGHGATARLVYLPHESHGYAARESILHTLWEMDQWLEKFVKNKPTVD